MVIIVGKDRRVIVDAGVDASALARVLEVPCKHRCVERHALGDLAGHAETRASSNLDAESARGGFG